MEHHSLVGPMDVVNYSYAFTFETSGMYVQTTEPCQIV